MKTEIHFEGDIPIIASSDEVSEVLENNKRLRSEAQTSDWARKVASIPPVIYVKWLNEEWARGNINIRAFGPEMDEVVTRKLNDPEWAYLRTDSGHIQGWMGFGS